MDLLSNNLSTSFLQVCIISNHNLLWKSIPESHYQQAKLCSFICLKCNNFLEVSPSFITADSVPRLFFPLPHHLNDFVNFAHTWLPAGESLTFYFLLINQLFHHLHHFNSSFTFSTVSFLRCRGPNGPPCSRCNHTNILCLSLSFSQQPF